MELASDQNTRAPTIGASGSSRTLDMHPMERFFFSVESFQKFITTVHFNHNGCEKV
jgi:hypothetical protein